MTLALPVITTSVCPSDHPDLSYHATLAIRPIFASGHCRLPAPHARFHRSSAWLAQPYCYARQSRVSPSCLRPDHRQSRLRLGSVESSGRPRVTLDPAFFRTLSSPPLPGRSSQRSPLLPGRSILSRHHHALDSPPDLSRHHSSSLDSPPDLSSSLDSPPGLSSSLDSPPDLSSSLTLRRTSAVP
ncbi:uncharacterized protein LOC122865301 isoform X2 [Siniperca chuatsi]|uniref:uncharacterized protein LOC122865301 isoform X2 n=1 Tax=Siniperca chuatsi TaxID=119488 RepID=UPI001CE189A9|nr:uncharacterized protein LOC122865301 isoform X2 [Siniperca chuatsi]